MAALLCFALELQNIELSNNHFGHLTSIVDDVYGWQKWGHCYKKFLHFLSIKVENDFSKIPKDGTIIYWSLLCANTGYVSVYYFSSSCIIFLHLCIVAKEFCRSFSPSEFFKVILFRENSISGNQWPILRSKTWLDFQIQWDRPHPIFLENVKFLTWENFKYEWAISFHTNLQIPESLWRNASPLRIDEYFNMKNEVSRENAAMSWTKHEYFLLYSMGQNSVKLFNEMKH